MLSESKITSQSALGKAIIVPYILCMCAKQLISDLRPIGDTREYFLRALDYALAKQLPQRVQVAGLGPVRGRHSHGQLGAQDMPRLNVVLEGVREVVVVSADDHRAAQHVTMRAGEAMFYPAFAPYQPQLGPSGFGFGLVWCEQFIRFAAFDQLGFRHVHTRTPFAYHTADPIGPRGQHLLAAMTTAASKPMADEQRVALTRLLMLVTREHLATDSGRPRPKSKAARTWYDADRYIDLHLHEPISREDVARAAGVSGPYLSRLCQRQTGRTYQQHLVHLRLDRAVQLLRHSSMKVQEVAAAAGFASARHFSDVFRREVGIPPGRYRRTGDGA